MDLSIIIVNYNTGRLVNICIDKVLRDTKTPTAPSSEIIVIENASTEDPVTKLPTGVKLIKNAENLGFSKAVNQGIKIARGRYILLLNPDTELKTGSIADMIKFAQLHTDAGVVGTKLLLPSGESQKSVFRFPTILRAFQEFILGIKDKFSPYVPLGKNFVEVEALVGAVFLITDKAREKVGLLDERYFMYFEDIDYCMRVRKAGLKVYFLPNVEFLHHHGASGKKLVDASNQWRRLVPSSVVYHGYITHLVIMLIMKVGQKLYRYK